MGRERDSEKGKYESPEGSHLWEYITAALCAFATASIGCSIGWMSPTIAELISPDSPILTTAEEASTLAASMSIGSLLAPLLSLFVVDRMGKKNTLLLSGVPLVISWGLVLVAKEAWVLILTRVMNGCSIGLMAFAFPLYLGEVLSSHLRGPMLLASMIAFNGGVSFMLSVGPYLGMRVTAGICLAIAISFVVGFTFAPESPYFLVNVGRVEEAERTLTKLRGKTNVADELEMIKTTLKKNGETLLPSDETGEDGTGLPTKENSFKQIFTVRGNLKGFVILMMINFLRNCSGLGTILSYCEIIFQAMGADIDVRKASMIFGVLQVFSALLSFSIIEKFNRKTLISTCGTFVCILLAIIGTYFFLNDYTTIDVEPYFMIPYLSVFMYLVALNVGVLAVPGVLSSEILAPNVKVPISCISGMFESAMGFLFTKLYLMIAISWRFGHSFPLMAYAILTWITIAVMMRLLPETRGKTLLEIQKSFNA